MTPFQIKLIRESWQLVVPMADGAAELFYARLFELDPSLRRMFAHTDMREQKRKLMQILAVVVSGLERMDTLLPAVRELGRRHAGYGVRDEHFDTVGEALLWTLDQGLGAWFTHATRTAWALAYETLADVMKSAALEARQAAA